MSMFRKVRLVEGGEIKPPQRVKKVAERSESKDDEQADKKAWHAA